MELQVRPDAFDDEVEIVNIVKKTAWDGEEKVGGGFAKLTSSGDQVYIPPKCVMGADLKEGQVIKMRMVANEKYMRGDSECKYYAFYAYRPKVPHQVDVEQYVNERSESRYKRRHWEVSKCDEVLRLGGVWSTVRMTNAVLGTKHRTSADMDEEQLRVLSTIENHLAKRHAEGTLSRVDIRKKEGQSRASYIFYTSMPEKLAEALRNA